MEVLNRLRSWVWEASRQTERILTIHTLHQGLVQARLCKVIEAENNPEPFLLGKIIWFLKSPLPI